MPRLSKSIASCSMSSAASAGPDHPETLKAMSNLALAIQSQGRLAEAEQMYREVLAAEQRVLGPEHPFTALTMFNLAGLLFHEGRQADAEKLCREALAIQLRVLGPEHPYTLMYQIQLG